MSASVLLPVLTSGSAATVITSGIGAFVIRTLKRVAKEVVHDALDGVAKEADVKAIASDVTDLKVKFASETGGNSHGLRQAVDEIGSDLAELKGAFNEHVRAGVAA